MWEAISFFFLLKYLVHGVLLAVLPVVIEESKYYKTNLWPFENLDHLNRAMSAKSQLLTAFEWEWFQFTVGRFLNENFVVVCT